MAGFVEGGLHANEKSVVVLLSGSARAWPLGSRFLQPEGTRAKTVVRPFARAGDGSLGGSCCDRRLHAGPQPAFATSGARDRLLWASVQPCTCSDDRHGFSGEGFGSFREPARLS
jgi:hypothetical protein